MTVTSVTWGEALDVRLRRYPGGWKAAAQRIEAALGPVADSRATVMKLKNVPAVESLTADERWRAWLVLTVIGEAPGTWGVEDDGAIPPGIDRTRLRRALASSTTSPGGAQRRAAKGSVEGLPHLDSNQKPTVFSRPVSGGRRKVKPPVAPVGLQSAA